jgi:hypothetical protein
MEVLGWIGEHWSELLQTAGLFLAVFSLRDETRERRIQNLFTLTEAHRDLWSKLYDKPELARVLSDAVNIQKAPPTREEEMFVHFLILHLATWYKARSIGSDLDDDAVSTDIKEFFSHPIPQAIWKISKKFRNGDFIEFVDRNI